MVLWVWKVWWRWCSLRRHSSTKIVKWDKVWLLLRGGRRITLRGVLHILGLTRNLIFSNRMSDVGVHTIFEKDECNMVRGSMVLMRGFWIGTLYKILGITDTNGSVNATILSDILLSSRCDHAMASTDGTYQGEKYSCYP